MISRKIKFLVIVFLLFDCSAYFNGLRINWRGANRDGHIFGTYTTLNGSLHRKFPIKSKQSIFLQYQTIIKAGTLSIIIKDPVDKIIFKDEMISANTSKKELLDLIEGDHSIVVIGNDTEGSFDVRWKVY